MKSFESAHIESSSESIILLRSQVSRVQYPAIALGETSEIFKNPSPERCGYKISIASP